MRCKHCGAVADTAGNTDHHADCPEIRSGYDFELLEGPPVPSPPLHGENARDYISRYHAYLIWQVMDILKDPETSPSLKVKICLGLFDRSGLQPGAPIDITPKERAPQTLEEKKKKLVEWKEAMAEYEAQLEADEKAQKVKKTKKLEDK